MASKKENVNPNITIRTETGTDVDAITDVTVAAFRTLEISNKTEQFIIKHYVQLI